MLSKISKVLFFVSAFAISSIALSTGAKSSEFGEFNFFDFTPAVETQLLDITSNADDRLNYLFLLTNSEGTVTGLRQVVKTPGVARPIEDLTYTLAQIREGVVLLSKSKGPFTKSIFQLRVGRKFNAQTGGEAIVTVLREYGIFSDDQRLFHVELVRNANGWSILHNEKSGRKTFSSMYLTTNGYGDDAKGIAWVETRMDGKTVDRFDAEDLQEE